MTNLTTTSSGYIDKNKEIFLNQFHNPYNNMKENKIKKINGKDILELFDKVPYNVFKQQDKNKWQKLRITEKTNATWDKTHFGIETGIKNGITVIDVDNFEKFSKNFLCNMPFTDYIYKPISMNCLITLSSKCFCVNTEKLKDLCKCKICKDDTKRGLHLYFKYNPNFITKSYEKDYGFEIFNDKVKVITQGKFYPVIKEVSELTEIDVVFYEIYDVIDNNDKEFVDEDKYILNEKELNNITKKDIQWKYSNGYYIPQTSSCIVSKKDHSTIGKNYGYINNKKLIFKCHSAGCDNEKEFKLPKEIYKMFEEKHVVKIDEEKLNSNDFSRELLDDLITGSFGEKGILIKSNAYKVVEYLNNFLCYFKNTHCFSFREDKEDIYRLCKKNDVITRIGTNAFNNYFMKYDNSLKFIKPVFVVNENDPVLKNNVYNNYKRPKFTICNSFEELEKICPLFIDYLKRIISDNDERVFNYLIHYISTMFQVGRTNQCLVFKGKRGVGKSTFGDILKLINESEPNEYSKNINDITEIMSKFNSLDERCIITTIEEVVTDAGSYHSVQNKLKDLITNQDVKLEKKGIDAIMVPSQNNILIFTNNLNPVEITAENRRYLLLYIKDYEIGNTKYFKSVKEEVKQNIEMIRGFFYNFKRCYDLSEIRPITEEELKLRELNRPSQKVFIDEEIQQYLDCDKKDIERSFNNIYIEYLNFCNSENIKKPMAKNYFSMYLKENGYEIKKVKIDEDNRPRMVFKI